MIRIPLAGLLAFVGSVPFLLRTPEHDSPLLGPLLGCSVLFFFGGLCFDSAAWFPEQGRTALTLFSMGGALTLIWAVLEGAWRHANMDELTELPGRRPLKHHMSCLGADYAIAVMDLDYFKKINDRYGHDVGDQVLRYVARHLARHPASRAYRFGGEEFVLVFEGQDFGSFCASLEELRKGVDSREFVLRAPGRPKERPNSPPAVTDNPMGQIIRLTVSLGVARSGSRYATPQDVLKAADEALYRAKEGGRNQVCVAAR